MIKNVKEKNDKISIDTIREEKINEVILKFTDKNGNFDYENFKTYVEQSGKEFIKEGYGLNFLGKRAAELMSGLESTTIFIPDTEHNEKEENKNSENIYISADNLEALRHLRHSYYKKIKCIYIDPPYNTGSDGFCYPDSFSYDVDDLIEKLGVSEDEANRIFRMQSKRTNSHSAWLSFMYARLLIARDLLSDDGAIFISIDEHEYANLKLLCDLVFNEINIILNIVVNRTSEIATSISVQKHEYMLCYAKNIEKYINKDIAKKRFVISRGTLGNEKQSQPIITFPSGLKCYGINDGIYKTTRKVENSKENIENIEDIVVENGMLKIPVKLKARWRSPQDMRNFFANECKPTKAKISGDIVEIYFENDKFIPQIKKATANKVESLILDNAKGSKDLEEIGMNDCFSFPKKVYLLKKVLEMINLSDNELVLDFFSGSATLAQAILEYNSENNCENKYILCQLQSNLDEMLKESDSNSKVIIENQILLCDDCNYPHTLDYIGIERIKRAAKKIKEETGADIDYGFKHFTLVDKGDKETLSMLERFDPNLAEVTQDEILNEFSIESRLITFLCDDGYGLTPKYEEVDLDGYIVYYIDKSLYLLYKGFDVKQNVALAKYIEKLEDNKKVNRLVLFGYAFSTREMQQLKDNLEKFEISDENIIVKY